MPAVVHSITVTDSVQMDMAINSYIQQGYNLANRSERHATMVKRKQFSILWLAIGLITLTFVLWIYLIVYLCQSDHMVQIVLQPSMALGSPAMPGLVSADGLWQWDGTTWQPLPQGQPQPVLGGDPTVGALSGDGLWRWDGMRWQLARAPLVDGRNAGETTPGR